MGGSVAWLCHYKAGLAGSFSKHFSNGAVKTKRNPELSAGSLKPNSPTLGSRHLSESEMATFVSVSFPSPQHSGLSTVWLRFADLCSGGLFKPVLMLWQLWIASVTTGIFLCLDFGGILRFYWTLSTAFATLNKVLLKRKKSVNGSSVQDFYFSCAGVSWSYLTFVKTAEKNGISYNYSRVMMLGWFSILLPSLSSFCGVL